MLACAQQVPASREGGADCIVLLPGLQAAPAGDARERDGLRLADGIWRLSDQGRMEDCDRLQHLLRQVERSVDTADGSISGQSSGQTCLARATTRSLSHTAGILVPLHRHVSFQPASAVGVADVRGPRTGAGAAAAAPSAFTEHAAVTTLLLSLAGSCPRDCAPKLPDVSSRQLLPSQQPAPGASRAHDAEAATAAAAPRTWLPACANTLLGLDVHRPAQQSSTPADTATAASMLDTACAMMQAASTPFQRSVWPDLGVANMPAVDAVRTLDTASDQLLVRKQHSKQLEAGAALQSKLASSAAQQEAALMRLGYLAVQGVASAVRELRSAELRWAAGSTGTRWGWSALWSAAGGCGECPPTPDTAQRPTRIMTAPAPPPPAAGLAWRARLHSSGCSPGWPAWVSGGCGCRHSWATSVQPTTTAAWRPAGSR